MILECTYEDKLFYMVFVGALNVGQMVFNFEKQVETNNEIAAVVQSEHPPNGRSTPTKNPRTFTHPNPILHQISSRAREVGIKQKRYIKRPQHQRPRQRRQQIIVITSYSIHYTKLYEQ